MSSFDVSVRSIARKLVYRSRACERVQFGGTGMTEGIQMVVFAGSTTSPVVSAPSLATIPAEVLKAAGIRRSGAVFEGFVVSGEGHPSLGAEVTNLEVV